MSVGIAIIGRDVTFTLGGSAILGVTSKALSFSNELGDTTDDDSSGWTTFAATALLKSCEFSVSGQLKNLELIGAFFGASQIFAVVVTYPDGSVVSFDAAMTGAPSVTHESNTLSTFETTFTSSGEITWVAGT